MSMIEDKEAPFLVQAAIPDLQLPREEPIDCTPLRTQLTGLLETHGRDFRVPFMVNGVFPRGLRIRESVLRDQERRSLGSAEELVDIVIRSLGDPNDPDTEIAFGIRQIASSYGYLTLRGGLGLICRNRPLGSVDKTAYQVGQVNSLGYTKFDELASWSGPKIRDHTYGAMLKRFNAWREGGEDPQVLLGWLNERGLPSNIYREDTAHDLITRGLPPGRENIPAKLALANGLLTIIESGDYLKEPVDRPRSKFVMRGFIRKDPTAEEIERVKRLRAGHQMSNLLRLVGYVNRPNMFLGPLRAMREKNPLPDGSLNQSILNNMVEGMESSIASSKEITYYPLV